MASSVKTRSPLSAVTGLRRAALTGYRWLLLAFLLLGGVQIFLAGLGAFRLGHPDASADVAFAPHRAVGFMAGQLDYDKAVYRMVTILAGATGATRAEAWIRVGAELRPVTTWPGGYSPGPTVPLTNGGRLPAFDAASRAVAVRHRDELLGALTLHKPRNEPLTLAEDKLLQHLASQAGLVFRNRRLTAELQATIEELKASRRRLVKAQDSERRKIERNLHDGRNSNSSHSRFSSACWSNLPRTPAASGSWHHSSRTQPGPHSTTCGISPAASTRRCWPTRAWSRPCKPRRARPPCRSPSRHTTFSATRRTPRPPCTSAPWRPCRTSPSTLTPPVRQSASHAPMAASSSPLPTTGPGSIPPRPETAPACKGWPTG